MCCVCLIKICIHTRTTVGMRSHLGVVLNDWKSRTNDAGIWHSKSTFHSQSRISVHILNVNEQKRTDMQRVRSIFQLYSKITSHKRSLSHTYQSKRGKWSPGTLFHSIRCISIVSMQGCLLVVYFWCELTSQI